MRTTLLALTMCGCAGIIVDGFKTDPGRWKEDAAEIRHRAAFELQCPAHDLNLTLLKTSPNVFGAPTPWTIGVRGCDRQAVYQMNWGSGWVMNSEDSPQAAR